MILWMLLGANLLAAMLTLTAAAGNRAALEAAREALRVHGATSGTKAIGVMSSLAGLSIAALWIAYAVAVDDWRFAAIPLLHWAAALLGKLAFSGRRSR